MRRSVAFLLLLVLPALLGATPPRVAAVAADGGSPGNGWDWSEQFVTSDDGTSLHADVFLPADRDEDDTFPVILSIGPYFGTGIGQDGPTLRFEDLMEEGRIFERGFAYVQVDSRGYGGSAGCYDMGGAGERMDAKAAVEWAAQQPWSTGKVGMWGKSYDAWTQVMALAEDPEGLAATVIQAPLVGMYEGVYENGVSFTPGWRLIGVSYFLYDARPNDPFGSGAQETVNGAYVDPGCFAYHSANLQVHDDELPYWRERDLVVAAGNTDVPVFWTHGFYDMQTKANNLLPVWQHLDSPRRAWFHQSDHARGSEVDRVGRDGFMDEAMAFLEEHLMGAAPADLPPVEVQDQEGRWRSEAAWPPADATDHRFPLNPGTYADRNGNRAGNPADGVWTVTVPAPADYRFAGPYEVSVEVEQTTPVANMVTMLYDVAPDGTARMIQRGAQLLDGGSAYRFESLPQDYILRQGHRLGLFVSASDSTFFGPVHSHGRVTIVRGNFEVPFLRYERTPDLAGGPANPTTTRIHTTRLSHGLIDEHTVDAPFPAPPAPSP